MGKKCLLFCCAVLSTFAAIAFTNSNAADASAVSEIAMELSTGCVFCQNNADEKLPMASTTKIMTALLIVEDCDLDEVITVPDEAVGVEGSSIYLKKNEKIDIKDLVYGLMLRSGNDAAVALAIHHSGSVKNFADAMNEKAKQIGAQNTNFTNPSGLPDKSHYTTARDLCEIARCAMQNPTFKQIVSTKNYTGKYRTYSNKNKFLYNYEGAEGVKTGYTVKAGRCLVTAAERNGMTIICAVLNCQDMYERCARLTDECFNDYRLYKIDENDIFMSDRVLCKVGENVNFVEKKSEKLNFVVKSLGKLKNIKIGDLVAKLQIFNQNNLILEKNLYSIVNV